MSYSINEENIKDLVNKKECCIKLPKNVGVIKNDAYVLSDDISIFKTNICANDDFKIYHEPIFYDNMTISFNLQGSGYCKINELKNQTNLAQKSKNLLLVKDYSSLMKFKKDTLCSCLHVQISKKFLKKYLPNIVDFDHTQILENIKANPKTELLAREILNSSFNDTINELYIQSKVLELIFLEFSNLQEFKEVSDVKFSEKDLEALKKAKEILTLRMQNPPSISELSRLVALNEFKLKIGFKKYFRLAPYQFLFIHKMQEAKKMLESGDFNVSEVSSKIGYKQVQSFSKAFFRHFGTNAKDLKGKKFYM